MIGPGRFGGLKVDSARAEQYYRNERLIRLCQAFDGTPAKADLSFAIMPGDVAVASWSAQAEAWRSLRSGFTEALGFPVTSASTQPIPIA